MRILANYFTCLFSYVPVHWRFNVGDNVLPLTRHICNRYGSELVSLVLEVSLLIVHLLPSYIIAYTADSCIGISILPKFSNLENTFIGLNVVYMDRGLSINYINTYW
jgi:hypothetical protein